MTRKLRGRGDGFLLCPSFFLDWDGSSAMGNHVKHCTLPALLKSNLQARVTRVLETQQARVVGVRSAGLSLGCRGDKIQHSKAT